MPIKVRGKSDPGIKEIRGALTGYAKEHTEARIEIYRQNPVSIHIRIIDPDFAGTDRAERHDTIWAILEHLPEEVLSDISILLLLTPKETETSSANVEFDHPVPSEL